MPKIGDYVFLTIKIHKPKEILSKIIDTDKSDIGTTIYRLEELWPTPGIKYWYSIFEVASDDEVMQILLER